MPYPELFWSRYTGLGSQIQSHTQILQNVRLVLYLFNVKQTNNWSFTNGPLRKLVCFAWKIRIHTLLVKSIKVSVPAQQITSVKQKEMLKHGGMNTRIQIKILNQLNTSESFLIINSIGKYFSRHLQTRNYVRSWNHQW